VSEFAIPTPNSNPGGIAAGQGRTMWFTETAENKLGLITLAPPR